VAGEQEQLGEALAQLLAREAEVAALEEALRSVTMLLGADRRCTRDPLGYLQAKLG
jgi:hypothetical protein